MTNGVIYAYRSFGMSYVLGNKNSFQVCKLIKHPEQKYKSGILQVS